MNIKRLTYWFLANAVLPALLPIICVWVLPEFMPNADIKPMANFKDVFYEFLLSGYYIFSALTLFFSLFENYSVYKACATHVESIVLGLLALATMIMFFNEHLDPQYLSSHLTAFFVLWGALALGAINLKYRMLVYISRIKILPQ